MIRRSIRLCTATSYLLACTACQHGAGDTTYRVALRHIPESSDPYTSQVDTDHFIMLQLYYPLFQHTADGGLDSAFLDSQASRAVDSSFKKFSLCLRDGVRFSDGSNVTIGDLEHSLREAHKRQELLPPVESIGADKHCANVILKTPDARYFEKLTGIASTITSTARTFGGFPIGLGPYRVSTKSTDSLILEANKGKVRGSFKRIEFRKFTDVAADYKAGVIDFNHTGQVIIPESLQKSFQRVSRPFFKSYALVVNYPSAELRKRFASCFPTGELQALLGMPLKRTDGFLPNGIQGSSGVAHPQKSDSSLCLRGRAPTLTFFNYRPELRVSMREFLTANANLLPLTTNYEEGTVDELVRKAFHDDRFAAVIGFDSSTSDSSAYSEASTFFESFIREARSERLTSKAVPGLSELVKSAARANDPAIKADLYQKAHQVLLDSGYVIPLGQLDTDQFYPKKIRHIVWSDRISGFPDISMMEESP